MAWTVSIPVRFYRKMNENHQNENKTATKAELATKHTNSENSVIFIYSTAFIIISILVVIIAIVVRSTNLHQKNVISGQSLPRISNFFRKCLHMNVDGDDNDDDGKKKQHNIF